MTRERRDRLALLLLVGLLSVPFLDKPFHIDDTYFLRITQNVLEDPVDPFAGSIDWWDRPLPVWKLASNPPLLSYYLAPFAAAFGTAEIALHAALVPFLILFALSTLWVARRFTGTPLLAAALVVTSPGLAASVNLMRDVPAAALSCAALAAVVAGTDRDRRGLVLIGFTAAGAALLTRFTASVILPLLVLYPILKGRPRLAWGIGIPLAIFGLWCLHNQLVYGEIQLLAQTRRGHNTPGRAWADNLCGLPVVVGSLLYWLPALVVHAARRRDRTALASAGLVAVASAWLTQRYLGGAADAQSLLWSISGSALLWLVLLEGVRGVGPLVRDPRDAHARDSLFLLAWLAAQLALAVLLAPFQAVRHLLPALPPLVLLGLRAFERGASPGGWRRPLVAGLAALQLGTALLVAIADQEYASSYRDFASRAAEHLGVETSRIWFLGHWGWMWYAEQAGLRKLHTTGPYPEPGDRLIVPMQVDKGQVLARVPQLTRALHKIDELHVPARTPLRTAHSAGAGFYALRSRRGGRRPDVPYRLLPATPLETFEIFEVGPYSRGP